MNKRSYILSALIIVGMIYSMTIGLVGGSGGVIQLEERRIVVLADDWPICSEALLEIANEQTTEGDMLWNRTYGGLQTDMVYAAIQTADGGFALAGFTSSYGANGYDFWLVKTDTHGKAQWTQTYDRSDSDKAYSVIQMADGGFALAGCTSSSETGIADGWLVKTDAHGNIEWQQTYGGSEDDGARAAIQTADGGFALAGFTRSYGANGYDFWLVKTDVDGDEQWSRTYGVSDIDEAYAVIQTADGGFALAGFTYLWAAKDTDAWLVKTDARGAVEWTQTYGGLDIDKANAVIETANGGFALAGRTLSSGAGSFDGWLVKTNTHGEVEWTQTYGGSEDDKAYAVIETMDGGFALSGESYSYSSYVAIVSDAWLVKTDSRGVMQWNRTYSGSSHDAVYSVIQTTDGELVFAGYTVIKRTITKAGQLRETDDYEGWLVKTIPPELTPPALSAPTVTVVSPNGGDTWRSRAPMPTPRADLAVAVVNERIYAIGGFNGIQNLATMEEYDPATDTWRSRAPMPTARGWLAATAVNGKIYALGGWDGAKYLPTVEEYDPATDSWRPRADMPTHRYGLAAVAVGGRIYAIGGQNEIGAGYQKTVEEYDPATNTWRPRADMATRRYGVAAAMVHGQIYAFGGYNAIDGPLATVEEYNPILNTWRRVADMPTAQTSLAVGTIGGRLYAIGGLDPYPSPVQEYDPLTNTWKNRTPLPTTRTGLAAAVVRGRLYAIGGYDGNRRLGTVEEYDPPFYDTDRDGFADDEELRYGRDPLVPESATETDTDGDGLLDTDEVTKYGTNPWVPDIETDIDGDGLANVAEVDRYGTNPTVADTEGDGLEDGVEVLTYKTNPLITDTDGDDLTDGEEVTTYGTNPTVADTDGDTYSDGTEVSAGTNPQDPTEHPSTTPGTATDTATTDIPAGFIPGFTSVELLLALACLVVLARRTTKR